jgi:O-acetyl-ADP-ribose deacetylase (regulator of RNase III)
VLTGLAELEREARRELTRALNGARVSDERKRMQEPILRNLSGVIVECVEGDITCQPDVAAIVNAANAELRIGGGVAGAIHRAAGPELEAECRPLAPIRPGQAVLTGAHRLPNRWVIHCLGPVYGVDEPADELLASCYHSGLFVADHNEIDSIAFPAISTGAFGYPMSEAAPIALRTVLEEAARLAHVRRIRFVLIGQYALQVHKEALQAQMSVSGL